MKSATATRGAKPLKLTRFVAPEHDDQCSLCDALDYLGAAYFSVPNFRNLNKTQYWVWGYLKAEGLKKGVPDIVVAEMRGQFGGMYIEMKPREGGVVSDEQDEWHTRLRARGYYVVVAHGATEAIREATNYLRGKIVRGAEAPAL
jgi:hypothetical protein